MSFFAHSRIWKPVIIVLVVIAAVWALSALLLGHFTRNLSETDGSPNTKAYDGRTVIIYETFGTADVECGGKTYGAYEDMQLLDDDKIHTYTESYVKISLDDDKFLLLDSDTSAELQADGSMEENRTELILDEGTAVIRIGDEFENNAGFFIITPDASIEIGKGIFCISSGTDESGRIYTTVNACGGSAQVTAVRLDATAVSREYTVPFGTRTVISGSGASAAVKSENEVLDYKDYSIDVLTFIGEMLQYGDSISVDRSLLEEQLRVSRLPYHTVTFLYDGEVFATQSVREESVLAVPSLKPTKNGKWNFDFSAPIMNDETIEWTEGDTDVNR